MRIPACFYGLALGCFSLLLSRDAQAEVLADTCIDFSTAAQGTAGWQYGYYDAADSTTAPFSTNGMVPLASSYGPYWGGPDGGDTTPSANFNSMHPGGSLRPMVRRYTVGSGTEPAYTGAVRIVGRFFDLNTGDTDAFIAVDPDGDGGAAPRTLALPVSPVRGTLGQIVNFDLVVNVGPQTTIDFGALALGSYNSDSTGFVAQLVTADSAVPTHVVSNTYHSTDFPFGAPGQDVRSLAFTEATDGTVTAADVNCFDTYPSVLGYPQFAGLLYTQPAGSGKVTRFDSVRIDMGTQFAEGGDFGVTPRLFILKHNSDPNTSHPLLDERYVPIAAAPTKQTNGAGRPFYTFDLTSLSETLRTGYGFAIVGEGSGSSRIISVAELSAVATDVSTSGFVEAEPAYLEYGAHRYALTFARSTWLDCEAEAVARGGHLVAINDVDENDFLVRTFGFAEPAYPGGLGQEIYLGLRQDTGSPNYSEPAGGFSWINGDALTFTNWTPGEPNNYFGAGEDYVQTGPGTAKWGDIRNFGYPETSSFRGIIELPSAGSGASARTHQLVVSAQANIFGAGQVNPTPCVNAGTGGVAALSVPVTGGEVMTINGVLGSTFSGADSAGADGAHHPTHQCDITGVAGVSGYLNRNNEAHLVGVFVSDTPLAQTPARLDFSANARGENFTVLAPGIGQVFFIGDGVTNEANVQQFIAPPGATKLYLGYPDAYDGTDNSRVYLGPPNAYADNTGAYLVRFTISPSAGPIIGTTTFPEAGGELTAAGGTPGAGNGYTWQVFSGNFPPHLTLYPDGSVVASGQPRVNGTYTFTVRATDAAPVGVSTDRQFTVVIADPIQPSGGIVAWWPGDDTIADIVGGRHGSLKNRPAPTPGAEYGTGKVGRGFAFDGSNDLVSVADHDSLDLTGDFTIEAWVNATATSGERTIVSKRSGDNSDVTYVFFLREGVPMFASRIGGGSFREVSPGVTLPAGLNHVAVTLAGSTMKIFINGTSVIETTTYDGVRPATSGPLTIGAGVTDASPENNPTGAFAGVIDELALYDRALTNAEVTAIFSAGSGGKARYDAAREFSLTSNPNGVWSYGWLSGGATSPNSFQLLPNKGTSFGTVDFWDTPAGISLNTASTPVIIPSGGYQFDWAPRQLDFGVSANSDRVVLRWKAPASGRYAISANFIGCDTNTGTHSTDAHVFHGTTPLFGGALGEYPPEGYITSYRGDGKAFTGVRTVQQDDTIDFVMGAGGNGYSYDTSGGFVSVVYLGSALEIVETEFPPQPADSGTPWKLTATGGSGNYVFSVTAGALPSHIAVATDGTISLVPNETPVVGRYDFTVTVNDGQQTAQRAFSVVVAEEVPLPANAVAWFPGELHAHDIVAGINATASSATFGLGKVGRAFFFNGIDQSVDAAGDVMNELPLTIEAWVKPEVRSDGTASDLFPANIVCNDRRNFGGIGIGANVFASGSSLWIELQTADPADAHHRVTGANLAAGKWTHVALVLTSGNAKTYVDGAMVESFDYSQGASDGETVLRLGRHNDDSGFGTRRFFKGAIDELTIYERALTGTEILGIYNADSIGKERHEAARDFFTNTNVAGQRWQYGVMNVGATPDVSTFARYDEVVSENVIRAWRTAGTIDPNVIKNVGATSYAHWLPGRLSAHPGSAASGTAGKYSVVRWTAPAPGSYAVASTFIGLNGATSQATTTTVHLRHKTTSLANGTVSDYNVDHPFFAAVNANAGDTVDFIVGPNGNGDYDATGLNPTVVLLAPAAEITTTNFPLTGTGRRLEPQGAGFAYSVVAGALPPGITLSADGTILGAPTQNGMFTFTVRLAKGGVFTQREFTVNVSDVPPPPAVGATTVFTMTANGKAVGANATVRQDAQFAFKATQLANPFASRLRVAVQYSATPEVEASWQDLSDSRMDRKRDGDTAWTLSTRRMPSGTALYFRTRTSATGFTASPGPVPNDTVVPIGPIAITPTPVIETTFTAKTTSVSGAVSDSTGKAMRPGELVLYKIRVENVGSSPALKLVAGMTIPDASPAAKSVKGKTLEYAGSPDSASPVVEVLDAKGVALSPVGSNSNVKKVQLNFAKTGAQLAPGASAEFSFWVGLRSAFIATRPYQSTIAATGVFAGYDGKLAEPVDKTLETVILPPVRLELTTTPGDGIVQRGEYVVYTLTAVNESVDDLTGAKATFTVPRGTSVVLLAGKTGNDFTGPAENPDPQETINPSLTPYDYGRKQVITWTLGNLPGTTSTLNSTLRTRTMQVLLAVQHDVPHTEVDANGTFHTAEIVADDYNLTYTPPSGGVIAVFDGNAPRVARALSAELLVEPPKLGVDKTATGDLVFRNATIDDEPGFRGDIVGVREGNNLTYQLNYHNSGETGATRCTIEERIPDGLTFVGFLKISRDGVPANEEELVDADYRFFDAKGKLLSGDPWFDNGNGKFDFTDLNRNGRHDAGEPGETFIDADLDKKFTPRGDITKTRIIVFNVGALDAGERGYIRYQCKPSGKAGKLIASGAYALRTESLREPIQGSPAVTYAKIIKVPAFEVQTQPNKNSVSPNDAPNNATALENATVDYDVTFRNVSGVSAQGKLTFDIPAGMALVAGSPKLFDAAGAQVGTVEQLPVGKPTTMLRCITPVISANQQGHLRFTLRALPSTQIASTVDAFQSKATLESATLASPAERERNHSIADLKNTVVDSSTVRLVASSRAELWGMKAVLMSQESRRDLSYMIVAGNGGDTSAKNVEVAIAIPPGTAFVSASPAPSSNKKEGKAGQVVRWKLGDLGPHGTAGMTLTVNIAHLDRGKVEDNSCVMTADNSPTVVPGLSRTTVRERPPEPSFWDIIKNAISAIGINIPGQNNSVLKDELKLTERSCYFSVRGADLIWLKAAGIAVIPNGGGQVVLVGPTGDVNGGTRIASAEGNEIRAGNGADMGLFDGTILNGGAILNLAAAAQSRSDVDAPNLFLNGNEKLVKVRADGAKLVNNDTAGLSGAVNAKGQLVAAGGLNLVAAGGGNIIAAGGMSLVAAGGGNVLSHNGGTLVAAGGLNLVAAGGGNLVAAGGGNLVAAGGLNLVAAGGGNLVAAGGGNLVAAGGGNLVAAGGGNLVAAGGGN